jgi:hypothetical protein
LYGMSEYLMIMHEVQRARLADQARRAGAEPGERHEAVRNDGIVPKIKARFGRKARGGAASKGATR